MIKWFKPPSTENEIEQVAYTSLNYTLWVMNFACILVAISAIIEGSFLRLVTVLFAILVFSTCLILLRRFQLYKAGLIFLGGTWLVITLGIFVLNGIHNAGLYIYALVIVYANIIYVRRRYVWFFMALSMVSAIILGLFQYLGTFPLYQSGPYLLDRILIALALFVGSGTLLSSTSHIMWRNLEQLAQNEQSLQIRNDELEQLTRKLQNSRARYRLLFDNMATLALVYDSTGQVVLRNSPAEQLLGSTDINWDMATIHDILEPAAATEMINIYERVLESGEDQVFEGHIQLKNGKHLEHITHIIPLPQSVSEENKHSQVLALTLDVTAKNQTERRMADLQVAQEKLNFFTEFFGIVSHDIKTPLTVMKTSLYLMKNAKEEAARQRRMDQLEQQVDILDQYVQDMLILSRLDRLPTMNKQRVDLCALVDRIVERLHPQIEQKNMIIEVEKQNPSVWARLDQEQMQRALLNIVENAVNYTPAHGKVQISVGQANSAIEINIQDTGMGIPSEDLPYIFEPFYRSSMAQTSLASGSGLGLAIVNKIIELHQGQIHVFSATKQGTLFKINLPATD